MHWAGCKTRIMKGRLHRKQKSCCEHLAYTQHSPRRLAVPIATLKSTLARRAFLRIATLKSTLARTLKLTLILSALLAVLGVLPLQMPTLMLGTLPMQTQNPMQIQNQNPLQTQLWAGPLHDAVKSGDHRRAMRTIEGGADVNEKDAIEGLSIFYAIALGDKKMVSYLIEKGAELDKRAFSEQLTILEYACSFRNLEIIRILLDAGADLFAGTYTPLYLASERGYTNVVRFLLENGVKVNGRKPYSPMVVASYNGHGDVMKVLLDNGVKIHKKYRSGMNALMIASQRGRRYAMGIALKYGSKLEAKNSAGKTALHLAVEARQYYAVRLLLDKGAKPSAKDRAGEDALQKAQKTKMKRLIQLVKKYTSA